MIWNKVKVYVYNNKISHMGDSKWKHREKHDNFFWIFDKKKSKVFWYFSKKKRFLKQNFGYFWPLLEFFKDIFIFEVFKNEIFSIMFYYSFQLKSVIPSVNGQNHCKYLHFYVS